MESCGLKCLKWMVFLFNFLFFIGGCALLGLGIWVVVDGGSFTELFGAENMVFFSAAYLFIVVGIALIIISFFGFCGAIKENRCMLGTFFAIVLVIFIIEIVAAILAFVYYPQVAGIIVERMREFQPNAPQSSNESPITDAWNLIQATVQCCGFNNSNNWVDYGPYPVNVTVVLPASCCERTGNSIVGQVVNAQACVTGVSDFYPTGCEGKIASYYLVVGGVGIAILVLELLAMIFACCLYKAAGKDDNYA